MRKTSQLTYQVKEAYNQLQWQYSDDPLVGTVLNYMYKRLLDAGGPEFGGVDCG